MPNNSKGHLYISVGKLCFKNALGLLINNSSNFQEEQIIIRKMAATFQEEQIIARKFVVNASRKANYHSKNHKMKTIVVTKMHVLYLFWFCPKVVSFWHELTVRLHVTSLHIIPEHYTIDPLVMLSLKPDSSKNRQQITFSCLLARNYIWLSKRKETAPMQKVSYNI